MAQSGANQWGRKVVFRVLKANCRWLLIALGIASAPVVFAQQIDSVEYGRNAGSAVRAGMWVDYFNSRCRNENDRRYVTVTDNLLRSIGAAGADRQVGPQSAEQVLANASRLMGMSVPQLVKLTEKEVDEKLVELRGCKSKKLVAWVDEAKVTHGEFLNYLADVLTQLKRNPGRQIFH